MSFPEIEELYVKQLAEHRRLDEKRIASLGKEPEQACAALLFDRQNREAIEGHIKGIWRNNRPDIIEALLGILAWQNQEIERLRGE